MKVKKILKVSDQEFYQVLIDSLKEDLLQYSKKEKEPKKGMTFTKKIPTATKNYVEVTFEIKEIIENKKYTSLVKSPRGNILSSYLIIPRDGGIEVEYEEIFEKDGNHYYNNKLVSTIISPFNKRKINKKLKMIESFIINNRSI